MDHNDIRHVLSDYLDGSLPAPEQTEVEEHLKSCTACSQALEELRKTIDHIKNLEEVDPPAWMTQKIMASVREQDARKKSVWRYWLFPFRFPVETVGVVLLAVTAFFLYRNIQPAAQFAEHARVRTEAAAPAAQQEPARDGTAPVQGAVPQEPGYKALDMKPEYESPQPPPASREKKSMSVPKPALPESRPEQAPAPPSAGSRGAAQTGPGATQAAPSAGLFSKAERSAEHLDRLSSGTEVERVVVERYQNGTPKLVETYIVAGSGKVKHTEERFNVDGRRHGIQKDFYPSGRIRTEAEYNYGNLVWYQEYQADGVKKIGQSDFDWYWLKK